MKPYKHFTLSERNCDILLSRGSTNGIINVGNYTISKIFSKKSETSPLISPVFQ